MEQNSLEVNNNILLESLGTHREAARAMTMHFGSAEVAACIHQLHAIEEIEQMHTIETIQSRGEQLELCKKLTVELEKHDINCRLMTIDEANKVLKYARNATPEVKRQKVEHIHELMYKILNGIHTRRDYALDATKSKILRDLIDKYSKFEDGELDMSRGFDVSLYPKKQSNHIELFGAYPSDFSIRDTDEYDINYSEYKDNDEDDEECDNEHKFADLLEIMSDEELLDGDYIDEEDFFVYGPYTINDMNNISVLMYETWSSTTNKRKKERLESILSEIMKCRGESVETDLVRHYIGKVVISARRLSIRNIVRMVSSFGQCCYEFYTGGNCAEDYLKLITQKLYWCSYYMVRICGLQKSYLLEQFGNARPITSDFFREIGRIAESWTDSQISRMENDYDAYLTKVDDHLFELEAYYTEAIQRRNQENGTNRGLLALGGLLG